MIFNWALLVKDFKQRILSIVSDKQLKMLLMTNFKSLKRFSSQIHHSSERLMILVCASPCTSPGHLFLYTVSKGSREENGTTSTEVLSGFRRLQRSQPKKKLIILRNNIPNFIDLTLEMTCQSSQTDISLVASWAAWISSMSFLSKNTKIQFQSSFKRTQQPHGNSLSEIHALWISRLKWVVNQAFTKFQRSSYLEPKTN